MNNFLKRVYYVGVATTYLLFLIAVISIGLWIKSKATDVVTAKLSEVQTIAEKSNFTVTCFDDIGTITYRSHFVSITSLNDVEFDHCILDRDAK